MASSTKANEVSYAHAVPKRKIFSNDEDSLWMTQSQKSPAGKIRRADGGKSFPRL
jgi:hypothetical protein